MLTGITRIPSETPPGVSETGDNHLIEDPSSCGQDSDHAITLADDAYALGCSQAALVCPICGKSVQGRNRRQNMENHMLIHTGVRPHKCSLCAYSSTQLGNLRRHMRNVHKIQQEFDMNLPNYSSSEFWADDFRSNSEEVAGQFMESVAAQPDVILETNDKFGDI